MPEARSIFKRLYESIHNRLCRSAFEDLITPTQATRVNKVCLTPLHHAARFQECRNIPRYDFPVVEEHGGYEETYIDKPDSTVECLEK